MKPFFIFFIAICIAPFAFSQEMENDIRVNAYYQEALKSYDSNDFEKVIYYCDRVEDLSGTTNLDLEALRLKSYYKSELHEEAKSSLQKFLSFNPSAQELLEIEPYIVKIEEAENFRIQKQKEEKELQERLERETYERAVTGTPYDIKAYLSQYSDGKHYNELYSLLEQREEELYQKIEKDMDRSDIEEYYKYFASGKYMKEIERKTEEIDEYEFYTEMMEKNTEEAFDNYLNKYPNGKYEREVNQAYAEYVYQNGKSHLERKNYIAARNYFSFYENRFPEERRKFEVKEGLIEAQKGIKKNERVSSRDRHSFYLMPTYVSDKNIGLELGGMSSVHRVSVYWTLEGKSLFSAIPDVFKAEKIDPEEVNPNYFEDIYATSTFGLNIRIVYPVWLYVGGGARAGFLEPHEDSIFYDEDDKIFYRLDNKDFVKFFPEAGIGVRALRRMAIKAGLRFMDDTEFKVGVGFIF